MRTHFLEGRKREEQVGELGNMAHCKKGTHLPEGRKREEWVGELGNMACCKQGLTCEREEGGEGWGAHENGGVERRSNGKERCRREEEIWVVGRIVHHRGVT